MIDHRSIVLKLRLFFMCSTALNTIKDVQVIELPIVDSMHPKPDFMPLSVPEDLGK